MLAKKQLEQLSAKLKSMDKIIQQAEAQKDLAKEATKAGGDMEAAAKQLKKNLKDVPE